MALYNSDGNIRFTAVSGTSRTGRQAPDGSYYGVLTSENTTFKGLAHPCGAYWITVGTDSSKALAKDGSLNVIQSGTEYVPVSSLSKGNVVPLLPTTTWSNLPGAVNLSTDKLTFTKDPGFGNQGASRTVDGQNTGLRYFEVRIANPEFLGFSTVGIADLTESNNIGTGNIAGQDAGGKSWGLGYDWTSKVKNSQYPGDEVFLHASDTWGTQPTYWIGIAINFTTKKAWVRSEFLTGQWNGVSSSVADPSTGLGGLDLSQLDISGLMYPVFGTKGSVTVEGKFGPPWHFSGVPGFSPWVGGAAEPGGGGGGPGPDPEPGDEGYPSDPVPTARRMQLGLTGLNYFMGFSPFLDWSKLATNPTVWRQNNDQIGDTTIYTIGNPSGAPYFDPDTMQPVMPLNPDMHHFSRLLYQGNGTAGANATQAAGGYTTRAMVAYCHSDWTLSVANCGTNGGITSGNNTNQVFFTIGDKADAAPLLLITPNSSSVTNLPNVKVALASRKTALDGGGIFDPDWLNIVKKFGTLRMMDWNVVNGSKMTSWSDMVPASHPAWGQEFKHDTGTLGPIGYRGGFPVDIGCALANQADVTLHYCYPGRASNSYIDSMATALKAGTTKTVMFELGNECSWESGVNNVTHAWLAAQAYTVPGNPWSALDEGTRARYYYGYRSAEIMKRISDIYAGGAGTRWRGGLATQSVYPELITKDIMIGVKYYMTNVAGGAKPNTLFHDLFVTTYMGDPFGWQYITNITKDAAGGVITSPSHGLTTGMRRKIFIDSPTSMPEINGQTATVTVIDANNYRVNINTSGYTTFTYYPDGPYSHTWDGLIWDMMDQSAALNISTPGTYPTKYTYFNQQLAKAIKTGTNDMGYTNSQSTAYQGGVNGPWKKQRDYCVKYGFRLKNYEGGPNWFAGPLMGEHTSDQFNEFFLQWTFSAECGQLMYDTYEVYKTFGELPSKFTEGGNIGNKNPWPMMRAVPEDTSNGQYLKILEWNN